MFLCALALISSRWYSEHWAEITLLQHPRGTSQFDL